MNPGSFEDHVLDWLKTKHPTAASVVKIVGEGTDWEGSTEAGFGPAFTVDIEWLDSAGKKRYERIQGEALGELWAYVVGTW